MPSFKALLTAGALSTFAILPAQARTILFLGSSFTYGAHSAAQHRRHRNGGRRYGFLQTQAHALQQIAPDQLAAH